MNTNINNNGYNHTALLMNQTIREMRDYVEYQKFMCRLIVDNEITREFKVNTEEHPESKYRFIYNNPEVEALTAFGKKKDSL